ncbi:MAG: hypothetical protein ACRD35_09580 [Candidatus Acidiferrales bacterium]
MNCNDNKRDAFLDQLLDAALARYAQVEPRPGLEERLLAGVRAEPSRPLWLRWAWLPAAAGGLALLLAGVFFLSERRETARPAPPVARTAEAPTAVAPSTIAKETAPVAPAKVKPSPPRPLAARAAEAPTAVAPSTIAKETAPVAPAKMTPRTTRPATASLAALPRRPEFPSSSPLSEQEQLLLRYVQRTPREELLTAALRDPLQPLAIEPLVIPPLPAGPNGSQEFPN